MQKKLALVISILLLSSLACSFLGQLSPAAQEVVKGTVEVTATPPSVDPSNVSLPTQASSTPAPTRTPNALQQTLEGMKAAVPTQATLEPAVDRNDFVAMTGYAWQVINDHYVSDSFNGADWPAVREEYLQLAGQVKTREAYWDLMEALVQELGDDHSRFVRPGDFQAEFNLPGPESQTNWPGLFVWPAREDEFLFVWDVCENGPAAQVGIGRGDVILEINDEPVVKGPDGWDDEAINQAIYGSDGEVNLLIQSGQGKKPRQVTLGYGTTNGCAGLGVYGTLLEDPYIGYLRIPEFSQGFPVADLIEQMESSQPLDGLVVDVRHNPGGNADFALQVFTQGTFGTTGSLREGATRTKWIIRGPVKWNETTPIVVLIDGASHSAAEYFAYAMQHSGRATLVGMPTAGNTEGITGFNLPDGSLIRLASSILITEAGELLEEDGVAPDVEVPLGQWGLKDDLQLQRAIQILVEQLK